MGLSIRNEMQAAPVSLPKSVTLEGSPLNWLMFSATQLRAAIWSSSAKLLTTPPAPPPYVFRNPVGEGKEMP